MLCYVYVMLLCYITQHNITCYMTNIRFDFVTFYTMLCYLCYTTCFVYVFCYVI